MAESLLHKLLLEDGLNDSRLLRTLIDSLPEQVYIKDTEGRYVLSNLARGRALGASSPEETVGRSDFDFYPEQLAERYRDDEREVVRSERPLIDREEPSVDEGGNERWYSTTKVPLRDSNEQVVGLVGVTRDVTERRLAEEALHRSEANLAEAQRMARLGSWEWNVKTGEVSWSDEVFRIYGFAPGEFEPTLDKLIEVVHPEDRELVGRNIDAALHENEPYDFEHRVIRPDGEERVVHRRAQVVLGEGGEPLRMVGTVHDVTEQKEREQKLKESEERYRAVMEQSAEAIWLFDPYTKEILESNTSFQELLGYSAQELQGMTLYDFLDHGREKVDSAVRRLEQHRRGFFGESKYRRKDGTVLDVEVSGTVIPCQGNEVMCAVARDLTERKATEKALKESEERFRTAFEDAPIGVALVGLDRSHFRVNRAYCRMLGYTEEELLEKPHPEIIHPDDQEESAERIKNILEGAEPYAIERRYLHADGHVVWSLSNISLIRDFEGEPIHFVCLHEDITERKELEERLRHQAFYDSLTGLPNRSLFVDRLGHALARARREDRPVAVLLADLDDFKVVNDSMGHDAGNAVLVEVAERLRNSVRPGDTVARIFGDEFAVMLEAPAGEEEAKRVAQRIEARLREPFEVQGREMSVTASIGITLSETTEDEPEEVLRHADLAMYEAKRHGKTQHEVYEPSMNTRAVERMNLKRDLRRAVEREEFEVYYQPKVLVETEAIVGVEALVRWRHPDGELLAATRFLPQAEETGLIKQIGLWVLRESCRQIREWQGQYPARLCLPLGLGVNLSAREIQQPDLVERIADVLRETGLDPTCLMLEISERTAIEDVEHTIGKLRELKDLGVELALDDFGTGYCALVCLEHSLFGVLKIDRLFAHRKSGDPEENTAMISAMTSMAHSLGLSVVVEGVETEEQLKKLREMGCEMGQGYYFAEPLPGKDIERLLEEGMSRQ